MANGGTISNNGLDFALQKIYNINSTSGQSITYFNWGIGTNTPAVTDTALGSAAPGSIAFSTGFPTETTQTLTNQGFISSTVGNGSVISEVAEFISNGSLFSRDVFTGITKTSNTEIIVTWVHVAQST